MRAALSPQIRPWGRIRGVVLRLGLWGALASACADAVDPPSAGEWGRSADALACPPRGGTCLGGEPTRWVDVTVDRSPEGERRTEIAQILPPSTGHPARVTVLVDRGLSTDPAARLVVDLRRVDSSTRTISGEPTAATSIAWGSVPLPSIPSGQAPLTVSLLPFGRARPLDPGSTFALVLRVEPGPTGGTALRVGAANEGTTPETALFARLRPWQAGRLAPTPFSRIEPGADLVVALHSESDPSMSCTDGLQGPLETDLDCGGTCGPCSVGKRCAVATDCASSSCVAGRCTVPACANGIFDQGEADVDCGGACSSRCGPARRCSADADCASPLRCVGASATVFGTCRPAICANGVRDQTESDVDCNATNSPCPRCPVGASCTSGIQCSSGRCDPASHLCLASSCSDRVVNGGESDIDCGRSCDVGCRKGQRCVLDADCVTGACVRGVCAPSPCLDGKRSPGETDVDCGGACVTGTRLGASLPLRCAAGRMCGSTADCLSGLECHEFDGVGRCVAPTCGNGIRDGLETDLDCGGRCLPCANDRVCRTASDCLDRNCDKPRGAALGTCRGTCADGVANGGESDVDCGLVCARGEGADGFCTAGRKCGDHLDCASGVCDPFRQTCVDLCRNSVRDVTEGDVDCGGECKARCDLQQRCRIPSDCVSGACVDGTCMPATCADAVRNDTETDVDCGGSCPRRCTAGASCRGSGDCDAGLACRRAVCVTSTCSDGVQGGVETDVDCGGACQRRCAFGKQCSAAPDCVPGASCLEGVCRSPTCADGRKHGAESDVDCGGSCAPCALGLLCVTNAGCQSRNCDGASRRCAVPSPVNRKTDGTETDVDCGGGSSPRCADSRRCAAGTDCVSGVCASGRCARATCFDGVKNGSETAMDCGGPCGVCPTGRACASDLECASNQCMDGRCTGHTCDDGVRNGTESDVDCGGSCVRDDPGLVCREGRKCVSSADCAFGAVCRGYLCVCPPGMDCRGAPDDPACEGKVCETPPGSCFESTGSCRAGVCEYRPKARLTACSDTNPCTRGDRCDGAGACIGAPVAGCLAACTLSGSIVEVGARNESNPCQICDPERDAHAWSAVSAGGSCDDGDDCTIADMCDGEETCSGRPVTGMPCGEGSVCTLDGCQSGCWISGAFVDAGTRSPANPCQMCRPVESALDWSLASANTVCDDGLASTTADACDGVGRCVGVSSRKANGKGCAVGSECASDSCVDGVCCNTACNAGDCDACSIRAGAAIDGICSPVPARQVRCRAAVDVCDAEEWCNGVSMACPTDAKKTAGTLCSTGRCDGAGVCVPPSGRSCDEIHRQYPQSPDGVYPIDPDGSGPLAPARLFCDMTGGGWTLVTNVYDSPGDDAPNAPEFVVEGWQQMAWGRWDRGASRVDRDASGQGSAAVSIPFVSALRRLAGQKELRICLVHQNGADSACRSTRDGSLKLTHSQNGNNKLATHDSIPTVYTYGRLAGLAGGVDGYDLSRVTKRGYLIEADPGQPFEFGEKCESGKNGLGDMFDDGGGNRTWRGVWHGFCRGISYRPFETDGNELGAGTDDGSGRMIADPSVNSFGFRLYIGPHDED